MCALSTAELEKVLVLINSGHHTSTVTYIWSKHCPHVPKSSGGHPSKLSPTNMCHAIHLINSGKAENATHVARSLQSITNQSLSLYAHLKKAGLKAVVKKKFPLLPSIIGMNGWTLPLATGTGLLRTGRGWYETKISHLGWLWWAKMGMEKSKNGAPHCHELHRVLSHVTHFMLPWHILDQYQVMLWKSLLWLPQSCI